MNRTIKAFGFLPSAIAIASCGPSIRLSDFPERPNIYERLTPEKDVITKVDGVTVRLLYHPYVPFTVLIGDGEGHGHGATLQIEVFLSQEASTRALAAETAIRAVRSVCDHVDPRDISSSIQTLTTDYVELNSKC